MGCRSTRSIYWTSRDGERQGTCPDVPWDLPLSPVGHRPWTRCASPSVGCPGGVQALPGAASAAPTPETAPEPPAPRPLPAAAPKAPLGVRSSPSSPGHLDPLTAKRCHLARRVPRRKTGNGKDDGADLRRSSQVSRKHGCEPPAVFRFRELAAIVSQASSPVVPDRVAWQAARRPVSQTQGAVAQSMGDVL